MVDTACNWVKPIYLTDHDIDVMDRQTKKDILVHNQKISKTCPEMPPIYNMITLKKSQ